MQTATPLAIEVATGLMKMSKEYKSSDPGLAADFKRAFKLQSKNDCVRTIAYLLEVVGLRDAQMKTVQEENKDLRELLKLNNIDPDKDPDDEQSAPSGVQASEFQTT